MLGQDTLTSAESGTSRSRFPGPEAMGHHAGRFALQDFAASRVLVWNSLPTQTGAEPDVVVGQADFDSSEQDCAADRLKSPEGMFVFGGKLLVSDSNNHRVLIWNSIPTTNGVAADVVLGQADFTHCAANDDDQDWLSDAAASARSGPLMRR